VCLLNIGADEPPIATLSGNPITGEVAYELLVPAGYQIGQKCARLAVRASRRALHTYSCRTRSLAPALCERGLP
jgi:hypothetical protein